MTYHYYTPPTKNRVSFAGTFNDGILEISAARCGNKENFNRKKGRRIAEGRLSKKILVSRQRLETCTTKAFVECCKTIENAIISNAQYESIQLL